MDNIALQEKDSIVEEILEFYDSISRSGWSEAYLEDLRIKYTWTAQLSIPMCLKEFRKDFISTFVEVWETYSATADQEYIKILERLKQTVKQTSSKSNSKTFPLAYTEFDGELFKAYFKPMVLGYIYENQETNSVQRVLYRCISAVGETMSRLYNKYIYYPEGFRSVLVNETKLLVRDKTLKSLNLCESMEYSMYADKGTGSLKFYDLFNCSMYGDFVDYLKNNPCLADKHEVLFRVLRV